MTTPQPETATEQPENAAAPAAEASATEPAAAVAVAPQAQPAAPAAGLALGKTRSPIGVWLLPFITFGIYALVWYFKINRELRDFHPSIKVRPVLALLSLFVPIVGFVSVYNTGKRIAQAQELAGLQADCSGLLGLVCMFVFSTHSIYYQSQLNRVWAARA